jgi:autotransporter translocation and assembly factor TamB
MQWQFQATMKKRAFSFAVPATLEILRFQLDLLSPGQEINQSESVAVETNSDSVEKKIQLMEPQLTTILHNGIRVEQQADSRTAQLSIKLHPGLNTVEIQTLATVRSTDTEDREVRQSTHLSIIHC